MENSFVRIILAFGITVFILLPLQAPANTASCLKNLFQKSDDPIEQLGPWDIQILKNAIPRNQMKYCVCHLYSTCNLMDSTLMLPFNQQLSRPYYIGVQYRHRVAHFFDQLKKMEKEYLEFGIENPASVAAYKNQLEELKHNVLKEAYSARYDLPWFKKYGIITESMYSPARPEVMSESGQIIFKGQLAKNLTDALQGFGKSQNVDLAASQAFETLNKWWGPIQKKSAIPRSQLNDLFLEEIVPDVPIQKLKMDPTMTLIKTTETSDHRLLFYNWDGTSFQKTLIKNKNSEIPKTISANYLNGEIDQIILEDLKKNRTPLISIQATQETKEALHAGVIEKTFHPAFDPKAGNHVMAITGVKINPNTKRIDQVLLLNSWGPEHGINGWVIADWDVLIQILRGRIIRVK